GFAHAVPLLAYEIDFDVDAGGRGAVEGDGNDCGIDALPRFAKVWEAMQADVPRRRIDAERGAIGDMLAGDVGDVGFELVCVRVAGGEVGIELEFQLALRVELLLRSLDVVPRVVAAEEH